VKQTLIVLKLGGGLITDKAKLATTRQSTIELAAEEVAKAYTTNTDADFLIGNGAGSYGHFAAHQYGLRNGAHTNEQLQGMCLTHNSVRHLNAIVVDALLAQNIPAFATSRASMMTCNEGIIGGVHIEPLRLLLKNRCVPVMHGDTVCDTTRGTTILSTERVLNECLAQLRGAYAKTIVIYAMNEDGVLDALGQAIPELSANDEISVRDTAAHDVTGGILGKIHSARDTLELVDAVYIINGNKRGSLQKAISGEAVGTRIIK
jgi:isopentenyl phosphate kinase